MNLSGFVQLRRGILDHTISGDLSLQEFAVFVVLVLLADKSTGVGKINGPVLRTWLPALSEDAAKRVLQNLEEKRYIFRKITPRSPLVYPYWVNRYQPTVGPYKLRQISLEQVFQSKDPRDIQYVDTALDSALETSLGTAPDTALEGAHYNKKDKEKDKKKENPSKGKGECASTNSFNANYVSTVESATHTSCDPGDAHVVSVWCAHGDSAVTSQVVRNDTVEQLPLGITKRNGRFYGSTGEIDPKVVENLIELGNQVEEKSK